jgi:hypothetical protein
MVSGRLKVWDREEIAEKMLVWAAKDTSRNLNGFCAEIKIPPSNITRWAKENEIFCQAYEIVKAILAERREEGLVSGAVHVKAYDLNVKVYDAFLKEESREEKIFESSLKSGEGEEINQEIKDKQDAILAQISSLQASSKASRSAELSSKSDASESTSTSTDI